MFVPARFMPWVNEDWASQGASIRAYPRPNPAIIARANGLGS